LPVFLKPLSAVQAKKNLLFKVFMKAVCTSLCLLFLITFITQTVYAQIETPTPTPQPQIQWMNEFTVENEPNTIIVILQHFISGFDSIIGGFVFYTPDPLADTIKLKDNSEIPGMTHYRNMFYQIAIPVLAIVIAGLAISKLGTDNTHELKSFAVRFVIVIALFLVVPSILSYSVQFNNLLVSKISTTAQFTQPLSAYFDKAQEQIDNNEDPEQYGIFNLDFSLVNGVFRSVGKFIVQIFLFCLTFLFLLAGFLYIGFQFVIRFATLLFLGVLYPIVLPFALTERTQGMVFTFFKIWFTLLIQQPAFVLGFSIASSIFTSMLDSSGPSIGLLFFYTGFLFFLGGVNVLVARIFGDTWTVMSGTMLATLASRSTGQPVQSSFNDFKKGLFGGSLAMVTGRLLREGVFPKGNSSGDSDNVNNTHSNKKKEQKTISSSEPNTTSYEDGRSYIPPFSRSLEQKGLSVETRNLKQGVVAVSGEAYRYEDKKAGLTSYYPTRIDAIQDGISEGKLEHVEMDNKQFIDLSNFDRAHPNPHNFNAMEESKKQGKDIDYAFVKQSSPPRKIKHFLELSKERNKAYGIEGVIVQRQARQGTEPVIRMYSDKTYEKRKNI